MSSAHATGPLVSSRIFSFAGGEQGQFAVLSHRTLRGPPIPQVPHVQMSAGLASVPLPGTSWTLSGTTTNDRYTTRAEKAELSSLQAPIGRAEATSCALILLRKNEQWWSLAQDERRSILEESSHHIAIGKEYLPQVARRLLHCRDMGQSAPFDFLGFLDYAPGDAEWFEDLLHRLRSSPEWDFVDRDVDIRLARSSSLAEKSAYTNLHCS